MKDFFSILFGLSFLFSRKNFGSTKICNVEDAIKEHQKNYRGKSNYKPDLGCGLCSTEVCIEDRKTNGSTYLSALPEFEWETDIFEFGLLGSYLPKKSTVKLTLNKDSYFRIEIELNSKKNLTVLLRDCSLKGRKEPRCSTRLPYVFFPNFQEKDCVYVAVGFLKNNEVQFGGINRCKFLATALFFKELRHKSRLPGFSFDIDKPIKVAFRFDNDSTYLHKGVPILLPCSQGGYAYDTETTRLLEGNRCKNVYYGSNERHGLPLLIEMYFGNDENRYFEKLKGREKYTPAYFDGNFMTLKRQDLLPKIKENKKIKGMKREICDFISINPKTTIKFVGGTSTIVAVTEKTETTTEPPINMEEIKGMTGETLTEDVRDVHFFDDEAIKENLDKGECKAKKNETKKQEGGGGGAGDASGCSSMFFGNEVIKVFCIFIFLVQLLI
ncbi:UNVERIFIED_CONTAM: hypothetical protein RMT77_013788 [Armadillidium vulgare]